MLAPLSDFLCRPTRIPVVGQGKNRYEAKKTCGAWNAYAGNIIEL